MADLPRNLATAFGLLTRLPALSGETGRHHAAEAVWAFPVVGAVVGLAGGVAFAIAAELGAPSIAAALIAIATQMLVTGALHEDGLADFADGLGTFDRTRALDIMRDSAIGTYGVLALIVVTGIRAAALAAPLTTGDAFAALIAAGMLSRAGMAFVPLALSPARTDGLGPAVANPEPRAVGIGAIIALIGAFIVAGIGPALAATFVVALCVAGVGWLARKRLGGYTGDVLGAAQQVADAAALVAIAVTIGG